jgi:hypothetical protein
MSGATVVGKFYEKRGEDFFYVEVSEDRTVLRIIQRDAVRCVYQSVNFFADSAPSLIALISKAAGLPQAEPVEYEYAIQSQNWGSGEPYILGRHWLAEGEYWGSKENRQRELDWYTKEFSSKKFLLVKRRKAGRIEDV